MQKKEWTIKDFKILQQIGRGKFGIVYKAIQTYSNQFVALKIIQKKSINTNTMKTQLKRQIQIHSRLKHRYICEMYGYFQDQHNYYLVLEYCSKGTLFRQIRLKKTIFSEDQIKKYITQLTLAICYLHTRFVIHRDIKIQNILIDGENNLKIIDFGWSVHSVKSPRKTFCGTLQYLSPEIVKHQEYTESVDIHCLGVLLYELIYHKTPFYEQSEIEIINNIKEGVIIFDNLRQISQPLKQLIILMLQNRVGKKRISCFEILQHQFFKSKQQEKQKIKMINK